MSDFFTVVPGVSAIDRVVNQPFTMGITVATPGDLVLTLGAQTCRYDKLFEFVDVNISINFTATYTTAAGIMTFTGLPFAADNDVGLSLIPLVNSSLFPWPNTATTVAMTPLAGTTNATVIGQKTGATAATLAITAFTSATAYTLRFRGRYRTARV